MGRTLGIVAFVALGGGCFDPRAPDGAPCGPGAACPAGQSCNPLDDRCYRDPPGGNPDGSTMPPVDAPPMTTCTPRRLFAGGLDPQMQGWTIERSQTGVFSISQASGVTTLTTSSNGRQLLVLRDALPVTPWMLTVVAEVVTSGGSTPMNAAIAIMASFHDPAGDDADRRRMLVLDENRVTWGDNGSSVGYNTKTMATYRLQRSTSGGIMVNVQSASGSGSMSVGGFTTNGSIAIGDQTTEAGLDSSFRLFAVDLSCL